MVFNVLIDFDSKWITRDEKRMSLTDMLSDLLALYYEEKISIRKSSVTQIAFYIEWDDQAGVEFELRDLLRRKAHISLRDGVADISVMPSGDENITLSQLVAEENLLKASVSDFDPDPSVREYVDIQMADMVGCSEFTALIDEICNVSAQITKNKTLPCFRYRNYLFAVNDGYGVSKYLSILSTVIRKCGLHPLRVDKSFEELTIVPERNETEREMYARYIDIILNCPGQRLFCIDLKNVMSKTGTPAFRDFLKGLEDCEDRFIFVFRVPFVEHDVLEKIRSDISDVLITRTVTIAPFTTDELVQCMHKALRDYDFTATQEAVEIFRHRLIEEKRDGRFYGVNTVNKIVNEMLYLKQLNNVKNRRSDTVIRPEDIIGLCTADINNKTAAQMLDELHGIDDIKAQIYEIVDQIEFSVKNDKVNAPCINMRFVGNPGTGKTTVARIIGSLLKERGVLRNGSFFEYSGRDLCGRYIGETAPKTAAICRDAYGSVLFIDEAYSLYTSADNEKDYGREVLTTLIAEMENHRHDLVVIMAGYTKDMETLMQGNAGLASRMPYLIEFRSYSREVLTEIFMSMVRRNFEHDDALEAEVRAYFENLSDEFINSPDFSNARFVRNLYEKTWSKAVTRNKIENCEKIILTADDFRRVGCIDNNESLNIKNKVKIGF